MAVLFGSIPRFFGRLSTPTVTAIGFGSNVLLGAADFAVGADISLSLFYLAPIAFVAWYAGRAPGTTLALFSGFVWYGVNVVNGAKGENPLLSYGDLGGHLVFFLIVTLLVAHQRTLLDRERAASRIDFLTGALTRRAFYEIANAEIERSRRHGRPFTVTYFDLDDFKLVNDRLGHVVGDEVLRHVVTTVRKHLRASDSIARLGGDEFAIILPEADGDAAHAVVDKMRNLVLEDMQAHEWPITLSIGVLTCDRPPLSTDMMMRTADQLMYRVKNEGKNAIVYSTCSKLGMPTQAA